MSGLIKQTSGCIGYIELIFAVQNHIPYGSVRNASGTFIKADLASVSAAAGGRADARRFPRIYHQFASGYRIPHLQLHLAADTGEDFGSTKKQTIVDFLHWMLTEGQTMTEGLAYAPLPKPVVEKEEQAITKIQ